MAKNTNSRTNKGASQIAKMERVLKKIVVGEWFTLSELLYQLEPSSDELSELEIKYDESSKKKSPEEFRKFQWYPPRPDTLRDFLQSLADRDDVPLEIDKSKKIHRYRLNWEVYPTVSDILKSNSPSGLLLKNHVSALPWITQATATEKDVESVQQLFTLNSGGLVDYSESISLINTLLDNINVQRIVNLSYASMSGNIHEYNGYCLQLVQHSGALYLAFHVIKNNDVYVFALDRITHVEPSSGIQPTQLSAAVLASYENPLAGRFGITDGEVRDVTLFVAKEHAHHFKNRTWYPGQTQDAIQEVQNGIHLNFTLPLNNELYAWILGWGGVIEVLDPPELIQTIHDRAVQLAQVHTPKNTGTQPPNTP